MKKLMIRIAVTVSLIVATAMSARAIVAGLASDQPQTTKTAASPAIPIKTKPGLLASGTLLTKNIGVNDIGEIVVSAKIRMIDNIASGRNHLWRIRVFDATNGEPGRLLHDKPYFDQTFGVPQGETQIEPSFVNTVKTQPGRYWVYLTLYGFGDNFELTKIKQDEEYAFNAELIHFGQLVTVPQ